MKKIIFLLSLCISNIFFGMQEDRLNIITLGEQLSPVFDKTTYEQTLVQLPCTSLPILWDNATTITNDLNAEMNKAKWFCERKPVFFATQERALFALNYLAKNPTHFSALILQDAQLDDYNYILNLHQTVPNIPIIFFTTQCGIQKVHIQSQTNILYAKMKQRSEQELRTYLIPPQGKNDVGIVLYINDILIHESLLNSTPTLNDMKSLQPEPAAGTLLELQSIEQKEKAIRGMGIALGCTIIALFCVAIKMGAAEKIMSLFKLS